MTPFKVNRSSENLVLRTLFKQSDKKSKVKFQVGDRVRITSFKYTFNKYDSNLTREIFIVTEILNTKPITYKIKDLNGEEIIGTFYNEELQNTLF
jgi:transcription antitermination factor NusG